LADLHERGLKGELVGADLYAMPGQLTFWTNDFVAPWQTAAWREQMRNTMRPNAYLRMIENRWVSSEGEFVPIEWYDACIEEVLRPEVADPGLAVWVGVDASVKRDSTAVVAVAWVAAERRVRLVWHRVFQPSPEDPLDFEATVEEALLELRHRFLVREVRFDPYQLVAVAQRLVRAGLPMVEFPQTVPNLTAASSNLYELLKGRNLVLYPDAGIRLAVQRSVALETSRGWRIAKEKAAHKIDVVVALAQACLGAVQGGQRREPEVSVALGRIVVGAREPSTSARREAFWRLMGQRRVG
jgi:phage terminase large subunit-like protein